VNTDTNANVELDFLGAALDYVRRDWAVLPLTTPTEARCSCTKHDCNKAGKHPRTRHGVNDATTHESVIRGWWSRWPNANVGIATGPLSGLLVLDLDEKDARSGFASLATLEQDYGTMPCTLACLTGTGRHLYFRYPGFAIGNRVGSIGAGLDVRSEGGYVVAPPSLHANGKRYRWVNPDAAIAELPPWFLNLLRTDPDSQPHKRPNWEKMA
jgi:putative DNA primase/helicase